VAGGTVGHLILAGTSLVLVVCCWIAAVWAVNDGDFGKAVLLALFGAGWGGWGLFQSRNIRRTVATGREKAGTNRDGPQ
jgi:hypothetical protein